MGESPRIEDLRRRVRADPDSLAFAPLAEEYRKTGRLEEAILTCRAGLLRHPAYLSARVTLGRCLIDAGRIAEAQGEFDAVLSVAPDNLAAHRALAEIGQTRTAPDIPPQLADSASARQLHALERFLRAIRAARASSRTIH